MVATSLTQSKELWYVMRGSGLVAVALLTLTMVAGVVNVRRFATARWPRAVTALLHRNVALLAVVFLGLHVGTAVIDTDVAVGWWAALVPWTSRWDRTWVALGTISVDLMVALVITSLLRAHLTHRIWRAVHWLAYVLWPLAMVHGFESGTDSSAWWARGVYVISLLAVAGAVAYRLRRPALPLPALARFEGWQDRLESRRLSRRPGADPSGAHPSGAHHSGPHRPEAATLPDRVPVTSGGPS